MENLFSNAEADLAVLFCLMLFPFAIAQTLIALLFTVEAFIHKYPKSWILTHWFLIALVFLLVSNKDVFFQVVLYCFLSPFLSLMLYCHKRRLKLLKQNGEDKNATE